jgi:kynureninase
MKHKIINTRSLFHIPHDTDGKELIYLCGNSLGLQPKRTSAFIQNILDQRACQWVEWWFEGKEQRLWLDSWVISSLARLVWAESSEVIAMNTLTINLHLALSKLYHPQDQKKKIVIEQDCFPSDYHAVASQIQIHGGNPETDIIIIPYRAWTYTLEEADIEEIIHKNHNDITLILLPWVQYYTGQALDIARITAVAKSYDIIIGRDLAHAIGNINLSLHEDNADFAVRCNYKYLNAWPGAIWWLFVHEKHLTTTDQLQWRRGVDITHRFMMDHSFVPAAWVSRMQISTTQVVPLAMLAASLSLYDEIGFDIIQAEREVMKTMLMDKLVQLQKRHPDIFQILTPYDSHRRWSQVSVYFFDNGQWRAVFDWLVQAGIIGDWRNPNVIRLSPVPLYNTREEIEYIVSTMQVLLISWKYSLDSYYID